MFSEVDWFFGRRVDLLVIVVSQDEVQEGCLPVPQPNHAKVSQNPGSPPFHIQTYRDPWDPGSERSDMLLQIDRWRQYLGVDQGFLHVGGRNVEPVVVLPHVFKDVEDQLLKQVPKKLPHAAISLFSIIR